MFADLVTICPSKGVFLIAVAVSGERVTGIWIWIIQLLAAFIAVIFVQGTRVLQFAMFARASFKKSQARKHGYIRLCALVLYTIIGGLMTVLFSIKVGSARVDGEGDGSNADENGLEDYRPSIPFVVGFFIVFCVDLFHAIIIYMYFFYSKTSGRPNSAQARDVSSS